MKKIINICFLVFGFFISGCSDDSNVSKNTETKEIITSVLDVRNGIAFLPDENKPFTGKYETYYSNKGGLECLSRRINIHQDQQNEKINTIGEEENVLSILWRKINKGKKCIEENYKDGKRDGLLTEWSEIGVSKTNYKDGIKNGVSISWWKNGQKGSEQNYKNGKEDGLSASWAENGLKLYEVNYIDGNLDKNYNGNKSEQKTSEPIQEIKSRCRNQMSEYGAAMVKACVDQDIEALQALSTYMEKHKAIIERCLSQMKEYGYVMVKGCADQDIEAEDALSKY